MAAKAKRKPFGSVKEGVSAGHDDDSETSFRFVVDYTYPPPPDHGELLGTMPHLFYNTTGNLTNGVVQTSASLPKNDNRSTTGGGSLQDELGVVPLEDILKILKKHPQAVFEKGFNGQTALHKAVLSCNPDIVEALLRNKADPNATNNFDETPLHFACKRGNVPILHTLVKNGADLAAVDRAGKGVVHHAAHGGSVYGMHYLLELCDSNPHVRDLNMSTPLHVVSAHGHSEILNYMLRKDRSDLFATTVHGNNSLHIAANAGHGWTCWRLMEEGGLSLLFDTNKEGQTPLDLAASGHQCKKLETLSLLQLRTMAGVKSGRAQGPILGWYCHALLPFLLYAGVLLLSHVTATGIATLVGMAITCLLLYTHSHRMKHVCRWPNPMFLGLFLAGMLYTLGCYCFQLLPYVYNTQQPLVKLSAVWMCAAGYMYYTMLTREPGQVVTPAEKDGMGGYYSMKDIAEGRTRMEAFCTTCELVPPRRTHHCKLCQRCYLDTDHHCLFLYRCVARNNHRLFVYFIILIILGMSIFEYLCLDYVWNRYPDRALDSGLLHTIFNEEPFVWTMFVANAVSLVWGVNLVRFQFNVVSQHLTTAWQPEEGRHRLTGRQRFYNWLHFMLGRPPYVTNTAGYTV